MGSHFLDIFSVSPFKAIQEHMNLVHNATTALTHFLDAVLDNDWTRAQREADQVYALEEQADEQKRWVRSHMPNSLFLPVSRSDLLDLLRHQDKIANKAKDICGLMMGRRMLLPSGTEHDFKIFFERCVATVGLAKNMVQQFDQVLETGFQGPDAAHMMSLSEGLDQMEDDTDRLQIVVRHQIFAQEELLPPVHVMFLYRIVDLTGDLADQAQSLGHTLQLLVAS